MKTKDLVTIASTALGMATLTVVLGSGSLEAGNEKEVPTPKIAAPKLVSRGIAMTLAAAGGKTFQAGDEPTFELKAVNTTGQPATVTVRVAMSASSPANPLSRVPRLPSMLWQHQQLLALNSNETRSVTLATRTKLPANTVVSVSLQEADSIKGAVAADPAVQSVLQPSGFPGTVIQAMNFSTASPMAQAAPARQDRGNATAVL